jgi:hypothetical protein
MKPIFCAVFVAKTKFFLRLQLDNQNELLPQRPDHGNCGEVCHGRIQTLIVVIVELFLIYC